MRPLDRGPAPLVNGVPKTVRDYKNWRADLIERLGNYCCFCNMTLTDSPQVEHVIAQDINPARALDWDNMLLACGPCNRSKSNHPCPPTTHYLPQFHNTQLAFSATAIRAHPQIADDFVVFVAYRGAPANAQKATNTIQLCRLDRDTTRIADQATDMRWKFRWEAVDNAQLWRTEWDNWAWQHPVAFVNLLMTAAQGKGFWSIWFDAFADVPPVRQALVERFPGTARTCFDATYNPIPRNAATPLDPI